jgi:hypothetical protein
MLEDSVQQYLSRLLLTFSDLCDSDAEIAACLTFMRITPPNSAFAWSAEQVRTAIPAAYSTVCRASEYSATYNNRALDYCRAIVSVIKRRNINE